ncbi:MAG: RNA polymerase sigma factor [Planctomycetes bacterium]|nr:RNA polymerase sigma factor [Planctomycetota bacterium]
MAFPTTLWGRIQQAGEGDEASLTSFVEQYRAPLLRYLRGQGLSHEDSEDVEQEVFLQLFSKDLLKVADANKGRFRSYLLGVTRWVLRERRTIQGAKKRGGGWRQASPEALHGIAAADPDPSFDANWFEGIIEAALADLAEEHAEQHRILQAQIQAPAASHQELSESLGITVGQVRVGLHRARGRLNRAVRAQLRRYVSSQEELDEEIACMVQTLGAFPG